MSPTAADVARFLGRGDDLTVVALATEHLPITTAMVRSYVRDKGFTGDQPGDDLAAVIVSCTARAVANPEQTVSQDVGVFSIRHGVFNGWTLPELAILHRYRKRAM